MQSLLDDTVSMFGETTFTKRKPSVKGEQSMLTVNGTNSAYTCYSLDYLFQLAVEMKKLGLPWISDIPRIAAERS